jgi:hypothetical protein
MVPTTENEKRMLQVIKRIHAGCNLNDWAIPAKEVNRSIQLIVLEELKLWENRNDTDD